MPIIKCGLFGAVIAGVIAFMVFILFDVLVRHDTNEGKAWAEFALMMIGVSGVVIGFGLGIAFGVIRKTRDKNRTDRSF
jgi:ABC-type Fe3+ transport system permease subunit